MATSDREDESLMRAYISGDNVAFGRLYARYSGRVYAYLRKKSISPEETDEVFQATFLKFHRSRGLYDPKYPILQWLYVVARTTLLDHRRKASRQVPIVDDVSLNELSQKGGEPTLNPTMDLTPLAELTAEQQQAISMRVVDELAYGQIAKLLGKSEAGVRQLVSRGLRQLRVTMKGGA